MCLHSQSTAHATSLAAADASTITAACAATQPTSCSAPVSTPCATPQVSLCTHYSALAQTIGRWKSGTSAELSHCFREANFHHSI